MSRPKKHAQNRRTRHVIFRLTPAEHERLCRLAERAGLPPNELARRLTRGGQRRVVIKTYRRCDPAFLKRIDQIGHNLNQIVKNAHIFGRISPRVELLCREIDGIINHALEESDDS